MFTPVFSGVRVTWSLVLCAVFCRSLFVLLYFFLLAIVLYALHRFRILITPLVSSNSSQFTLMPQCSWDTVYNYLCNQCVSLLMLWRDVLNTTLCDNVCWLLVAGRWFFPSPSVSSTNKTDRHNTTEILLKVALKHYYPITH